MPTPLPTPAPKYFVGSAADGQFGFSVALSSDGNVLAIGAPFHSQEGLTYRGLVRVFRFIGGSWSSTTFIGDSAQDQLGWSVALSADGNVLAVGVPNYVQSGFEYPGLVRVFRFIGNSWSSTADIIGRSGSVLASNFGRSVALSDDGNVLAVGAPYYSPQGRTYMGFVQVLRFIESSWSSITDLFGSEDGDQVGTSVALSSDGNVLAVGTLRGLVQVFRFIESSWSSPTDIIGNANAANSNFGWSVALSSDGNVLVVGAPYKSQDQLIYSGLVQVFRFIESSWSSPTDIIGNVFNGNFGWSVALSADGNVLAVGAPGDGRVQVFQFIESSWSSPTDFIGIAASDFFGRSVALSAAGNVLAVGAPLYDEDGLDNCGLVQVLFT